MPAPGDEDSPAHPVVVSQTDAGQQGRTEHRGGGQCDFVAMVEQILERAKDLDAVSERVSREQIEREIARQRELVPMVMKLPADKPAPDREQEPGGLPVARLDGELIPGHHPAEARRANSGRQAKNQSPEKNGRTRGQNVARGRGGEKGKRGIVR